MYGYLYSGVVLLFRCIHLYSIYSLHLHGFLFSLYFWYVHIVWYWYFYTHHPHVHIFISHVMCHIHGIICPVVLCWSVIGILTLFYHYHIIIITIICIYVLLWYGVMVVIVPFDHMAHTLNSTDPQTEKPVIVQIFYFLSSSCCCYIKNIY